MRLSKHLYFFVAAAIASAIHGAPIGCVLDTAWGVNAG